jgi:hypothetical protein
MKAISNFFGRCRKAVRYLNLAAMLYKATKDADRMAAATGNTYFVVKGPDNSLITLTRSQYRKLTTKSRAKYVTSMQMFQGCFYCTKWYDGKQVPKEIIQRKRRIFFAAFLG